MNVFDMFARLLLDTSAYDAGLEKAQKSFKIASGAIAAAGAAAAAAVGKLAKDAVDSYAKYEQLVGGVETLFGTAASRVQQYATDAYKTAGLSANEYMETVTSFSASLLQSLGGDTQLAEKLVNIAFL